jgi:hypothetical protein
VLAGTHKEVKLLNKWTQEGRTSYSHIPQNQIKHYK